jgi:hypothetical protein
MKTSTPIFLLVIVISLIFFSSISAQVPTNTGEDLQTTSSPVFWLYFPRVYHLARIYTPSPTPTQTPTRTPTPTSNLLPDLHIQGYGITYFDDCPWGSPGIISVNTINNGLSYSGEFTVEINSKFAFVEGLKAQATTNPSIEFEAGPVGSVYAIADIYNQVDESDESNNFFGIAMTAPPPCTPTITPTP